MPTQGICKQNQLHTVFMFTCTQTPLTQTFPNLLSWLMCTVNAILKIILARFKCTVYSMQNPLYAKSVHLCHKTNNGIRLEFQITSYKNRLVIFQCVEPNCQCSICSVDVDVNFWCVLCTAEGIRPGNKSLCVGTLELFTHNPPSLDVITCIWNLHFHVCTKIASIVKRLMENF